MDRVVTDIVKAIDFITLYGDIIDYYGVGVTPQDIEYSDDCLIVSGLRIKVENGRYALLQALKCFSEPLMHETYGGTRIAGNSKISDYAHHGYNCVIGNAGFGYVRHKGKLFRMPHVGDVVIENDVIIHNSVCIDRAVNKSTIIGEGTKIDNFCHIAHNVVIGKNNTLAAHTIIEGGCKIGDNNTFGTGVIVQRKVTMGNNCIIGSGAVVTKDVPDNSVMVGNPAKLLRYNETQTA